MKVLLVGAGGMAQEYNKVLQDINCSYEVIGRGVKSAKSFEKPTGKKVIIGGIDSYLANNSPTEFAIVATGVEVLAANCKSLINAGVKNILVEKPGAMTQVEFQSVTSLAKEKNANVIIAYNRRFFASTIRARKIIKEDGGVTSFNFEFTEWSHVIENLTKADGVMGKWFLANSTHVVDLAFFLGGKPKEISTFSTGSLKWHTASSNFAGSGVSETNALFSYFANWEAPGRWRVEILTKKHRLYFSPMEKLQIQEIGSVSLNDVEIDYSIDEQYKPGLFLQTKNFLDCNFENMCSIEEQRIMLSIYEKIANY